MMWLFDSPFPILIIGGLSLAIILGGWFQTQRKELLIALVAAIVFFGGLLALERSIVTPREAIAATIAQIAQEAEANDVEAMVRHVHSRVPELQDHLRGRMALVDIHKVSVKNNLKVDVFGAGDKARVTFNVVVTGSDRTGTIKDMAIPRFIEATFEREDGHWRCVAFEDREPQVGMQLPSAP